MRFDVGECIRNPEFREFIRKQDLKVWDMIQIILHAYASMQQKRAWLYRLLQTVGEEEKQEVQNMLDLVDLCLRQIYQTDENVVYVAECRNTTEPDDRPPDVIITSEAAELTFHDDITEMIEYLERIYTPEPDDEVNQEMYIYQIIKAPHEKHRIKLEFSMTWFDGKIGIFYMYPNGEWLEQEGISEETDDDFNNEGISYRKLPFEKGDRLRIKTPLMRDYVYGTIRLTEYDGCGCWYYWFIPDGKETDDNLIPLSYHEIDLRSRYAVYDWVERVKD